MNHLLTNHSGIDTVINNIQQEIYPVLKERWNNADIDCYGRVYRYPNRGGEVTPVIMDVDGEYNEVFFDDNKAGHIFFIDQETATTEDGFVFTTDIKCVFHLNLQEVITFNERQDERARRDAIEVLDSFYYLGHNVTGYEKGIQNVFSGFETEKIKLTDMHPYHVFAVNLRLSYYLTDKCL